MVLPAQGPVKRAVPVEEEAAGRRQAAASQEGMEVTEVRREELVEVEVGNMPLMEPARAGMGEMVSSGYGRGS